MTADSHEGRRRGTNACDDGFEVLCLQASCSRPMCPGQLDKSASRPWFHGAIIAHVTIRRLAVTNAWWIERHCSEGWGLPVAISGDLSPPFQTGHGHM